jgi:nitrite reductase/ring-hydroxylating ferredoxin subunit
MSDPDSTVREIGPGRGGTTRFVVARASDIPEGARLVVDVADRTIGVFNVDGAFYALLNRCPHMGGPLCAGQVLPRIDSPAWGELRYAPGERYVACPWHNWEFDLRTGQSYWDPARTRARAMPVAVESGAQVSAELAAGADGRVPGPYVAETMDVDVEDEYVVVSLRVGRPALVGTSDERAER